MVEAIDPVVESAAGEEPLAIGRPDQAGETGGQSDAGDDLAGRSIDGHDLVLAVPGVKDGQDRLGSDGRRSGPADHPASSAARPA